MMAFITGTIVANSLSSGKLCTVGAASSSIYPIFCYGSNSNAQLRERVQNDSLVSYPSVLHGYHRFFAGNSIAWGGGGVASVVPKPGGRCMGTVVYLSSQEIERLDRFEGIREGNDPFSEDSTANVYRRQWVDVTINDSDVIKAIAYIRNRSDWEDYPSDKYLSACYRHLSEFWPDLDGEGYLHVYDSKNELRGKFKLK